MLYATLLIAGSAIAKTEWEKFFMIWLAEHDQNLVGIGIVGIDFDDIFWSVTEFEAQQKFVVQIAQRAIEERVWTKLDYEPDETILLKILNLWIAVFSNAETKDIAAIDDFVWYAKPDLSTLDEKCAIHHIFLNRLGTDKRSCCYLCNDKPSTTNA